jgi:hypothetical protein
MLYLIFLHRMFRRLIRTPIAFFDANPVGRNFESIFPPVSLGKLSRHEHIMND